MEQLNVKLTGLSPLMTHNVQLANPLGRYAISLKQLTGKRNKTDADLREISRIEWEAGLYLEGGVVVMPSKCLSATFFEGAKKTKNGPKWRTGVYLGQDFFQMDYAGPKIKISINGDIPNPGLDKYFEKLVNQDMVRVGNSMVLRSRPIFHDWSIDNIGLLYDENIIDKRTLLQICSDGGYLVGLCERRPGSKGGGTFGRFEVAEVE